MNNQLVKQNEHEDIRNVFRLKKIRLKIPAKFKHTKVRFSYGRYYTYISVTLAVVSIVILIVMAKPKMQKEIPVADNTSPQEEISEKSGFEILVDGKSVATIDTKEMAEQILKHINSEMQFVQDVQIAEKKIHKDYTVTFEEILEKFIDKSQTPTIYIVKRGDSLWSVANKNNLTIDGIKELNPGIGDLISVGQEIIVSKPKYIVTGK